MKSIFNKSTKLYAGATALALGVSTPAFAAPDPETAYILNTLLFLIGGFLVMWMAAGFAMLESGLVRSKNVATICVKNISLFALAGIMYYLMGYNLMYADVAEGTGLIGTFSMWGPGELASDEAIDVTGNYASASDWFFQMVFVATAASVVSGALAERIKLLPFLIFVAVLTGIIYPIQGSWSWGAGYLSGVGFSDFAGSSIVHGVGGWAALVGALVLGPRLGKYDSNGKARPMPGSSLPLATLGTFILWFGWFGFNGASQLAMASAVDAVAISQVFANTNMAAAGGVIGALVITKLVYKKVDLTMVLNGALAGLVSITADPLSPTIGQAILVGAAGGIIAALAVPVLDKLKIDDVVGAIPVHLIAGIWGTIAVAFWADDFFGQLVAQLIGIGMIGGFVIISSAMVWLGLKYTIGIRLTEDEERLGSDLTELGLEAYPEFGRGSQKLA